MVGPSMGELFCQTSSSIQSSDQDCSVCEVTILRSFMLLLLLLLLLLWQPSAYIEAEVGVSVFGQRCPGREAGGQAGGLLHSPELRTAFVATNGSALHRRTNGRKETWTAAVSQSADRSSPHSRLRGSEVVAAAAADVSDSDDDLTSASFYPAPPAQKLKLTEVSEHVARSHSARRKNVTIINLPRPPRPSLPPASNRHKIPIPRALTRTTD